MPMILRFGPATAEALRRLRSRGSRIDLVDGLETGSPDFVNLYKCAISNSLCGECKLKRALQDMEAPAWSLGFFSYSKNNLKYAV